MAGAFMNMLQNMAPRSNRSISDLASSNDSLSGMDALELRGWASSNPLLPRRDMTDPLGSALLSAFSSPDPTSSLSSWISERSAELNNNTAAVIGELFAARWGPTRIPIYNIILQFLLFTPENKDALLSFTRWLALEQKLPVGGTDVLGCTALYWSVSTKPYAEPEFAQILFDAGGSVNQKNRLGGTAAGEIAQADIHADTTKNVEMMRWWVQHGGDVDAKDNDGMNARTLVEMLRKKVPGMAKVVEEGRGKREEVQCETCGRRKEGLMACARCKGVRYCSQECQKVDWKGHKKVCGKGGV